MHINNNKNWQFEQLHLFVIYFSAWLHQRWGILWQAWFIHFMFLDHNFCWTLTFMSLLLHGLLLSRRELKQYFVKVCISKFHQIIVWHKTNLKLFLLFFFLYFRMSSNLKQCWRGYQIYCLSSWWARKTFFWSIGWCE